MAFKGDISAMILGALDPHPLHGYQIARRLKEVGGAGKMSEGQIYPYLHRLEAGELLNAQWDTTGGGPAKRVYSLTTKGRQELQKQRDVWKKFADAVGSLLSKNSTTEIGLA